MIKIKMNANDSLLLFGDEDKIKKFLGELYDPRCFYQKNTYWCWYKKSYYVYIIGSYRELLEKTTSGEKIRFISEEEEERIKIKKIKKL